jgi:hypothetical protein
MPKSMAPCGEEMMDKVDTVVQNRKKRKKRKGKIRKKRKKVKKKEKRGYRHFNIWRSRFPNVSKITSAPPKNLLRYKIYKETAIDLSKYGVASIWTF